MPTPAWILLAFAMAAPALAQAQDASSAPKPVPIEEWSLSKVSAMGREIYNQDTAAWVATDALLAATPQEGLSDLRGWIVEPSGPNQLVRFLRTDGEGFRAGWDVPVIDGKAGAVEIVTEGFLTPDEQARWNARQTAMAKTGSLRCSRNLNTVVADDPDSDGWLVWLLTSTDQNGVLPVGGNYRFKITPDGKTVLRRDQLSNGCLNLQVPVQGSQAVLFVTQLVSTAPVETHVFLSLQHQQTIYVGTKDRTFAVEGDRIEDVTNEIKR